MIDSSHWECILAGLKNAQGKCIVNSISLKDGEEAFLAKAREIHRLGAAMVVMAFDEEGQATTYERKIAVCERAYRLLTGIGIPAEDLIFDVNVLSIGTGIPEHDRYGIDFIEAVRWIKQNLPGAYTSGGISNLSFAFRGNNPVRSAMHAVFLYHAIRAGLDMAIVNPGMILQYDDIEPELRTAVEDLILCRDPHATERLMAVATDPHVGQRSPQDDSGNGQRPPQDDKGIVISSGAAGGVEKSLETFLLTGKEEGLAEAVNAARERLGSAVQVIEGPLMAGMEEVGRRFGEGKMFLPQVVKSAKVMKDAVALLEPYMEAGEQAAQRPVVIHATVKGDVHDIGKNIAGIVLRCNGFEVVDLGVMVDKETILEAAEKHHAALIGVSGLITPSLFQMEELCREMAARGLYTPLFIGGATTSALHTAVKLAPLYDHVFYAPDASAGAVLAKKCLRDRAAFEAAQHAEQARIRDLHEGRKATPAPVKTGFEPESYLLTIPADIPLTELSLEELVPLFDWSMFRAVWGVKENAELTAEGRAVLDRMVRTGGVSVRLAARFFAARRDGDTIDLGPCRLPMLRQEEAPGRSLADFVPADGTGPFGVFAISVHAVQSALRQAQGPQLHPVGCTCEACRNDYDSMMERAVRVTLAEAASTWLDKHLAQGLPEGTKVAKPAAGYASCPDHSLKRDILGMLPEGLDITLTESCAMIPDASICGFVVLHPEAGYPEIRHIGREQYELYKSARGFSPDEARAFLSHFLDARHPFPSLEIIPPQSGIVKDELLDNIAPLMEFKPRYINVTTHRDEVRFTPKGDGTFLREVVRSRVSPVAVCGSIQSRYDVEVVPHIICAGNTAAEIEWLVKDFHFLGIDNVMALRGDSLAGEKRFNPVPGGYAHADELVRAIREMDGGRNLCIGVGGYPEKHFEAANPETDIQHLKGKVDAGADCIITQMFFDNKVFYRFVAHCRAAGITVPIIPGLKPLTTARQVNLLPESFSIDIPVELTDAVHDAGDDKEAVRRLGVEWCTAQCRDLLQHGVPAVHFYTMGKSSNVVEVLRNCF